MRKEDLIIWATKMEIKHPECAAVMTELRLMATEDKPVFESAILDALNAGSSRMASGKSAYLQYVGSGAYRNSWPWTI
jgi:hypothetical protein